MNATHHTKPKPFVVALAAAAAAPAAAPTLLFVGAGTAYADDPCYGSLQGSYYCSPAAGINSASPQQVSPVQPAFGYNNLPGRSGGTLPALAGALSGEGC